MPAEKELSVKDVAVRASGYGIPGVIVDGTDVLACYAAGREAIDRARSGGGPTLIEAKVTRLTAHSSDDQQTKYRTEEDLAEGRAHDPLPIFREQLRGAGVLTDELEAALDAEIAALVEDATDFAEGEADPDPFTAVDHVYAEAWPSEAPPPWHPLGTRRVRRPRRRALMPVRTFIEAIRDGMAEEMRRDDAVVVLGEDVGKKGGVFLATDGLWAEFGDDRVIDTPLTESMIVGASIGAALNGLRPVAEIQFADFIHPAFNQIVSEAARMRYRTNGEVGVPMVIRAPYGGGVHGALYHSQSVEAFFTHVPGSRSSSRRPRTTRRACCGPRSATTTRSCSSSTRRCTARSAARCRRGTTRSRSGGRRSAGRAARSASSRTGSWSSTRSRPRNDWSSGRGSTAR